MYFHALPRRFSSAIRVSRPYLFEPAAINDRGQVALDGSDEWILWQGGAVRHRGTGEIMALKVKGKPIYGVQFHPESVLTSHGKQILSNFLRMCGQ